MKPSVAVPVILMGPWSGGACCDFGRVHLKCMLALWEGKQQQKDKVLHEEQMQRDAMRMMRSINT